MEDMVIMFSDTVNNLSLHAQNIIQIFTLKSKYNSSITYLSFEKVILRTFVH